MADRIVAGAAVQTPFGKGVVREIRNGGRVLVDVQGRSMVMKAGDLTPIDDRRQRAPAAPARGTRAPDGRSDRPARRASAEVDLHGMTVEDALARAEQALDAALLADLPELRLIHGRSGGRIKAALHRRLRSISAVRAFAIDPRNEGVTVVRL